MNPSLRSRPRSLSSLIPRVSILAVFGLMVTVFGCSRRIPEPTVMPVLFPPPPAQARVQYLGGIASPEDLPRRRTGLAAFVMGPEPIEFPMRKPINAILVDTRLYICDTVLNTVLVYDLATGEARALRGDRGIGKIKQPNNITTDDQGRFLVADKDRQAVLVYDAEENFVDAWGRPGEAAPVDVAVTSSTLLVCDIEEHEIEVWSRADGSHFRSIGTKGNQPGQFIYPTYVALDSDGSILVTDTGNFRVQRLTQSGEPLQVIGGLGNTLGKFAWPKGMDVDSHGRIYVADTRFANIQMFTSDGRLLLFFGGPGPDNGNLDLPAGLTVQPWPADIPWLTERLLPEIDPEFLLIAVNQQGPQYVNFFAIARDTEGTP